MKIADYECQVHGRFEATVPDNIPDEWPCPFVVNKPATAPAPGFAYRADPCPRMADFRISAPLIGRPRVTATRGGWAKPERPTYFDTRNLGEGQSLEDFQADRKAIHEEARKADVMKFKREH